jgi:predicted Zn finger-like uncharacterized protein
MKFVCDRCQTKYSIADDKVRGKVLKVRCKTCQNVITVREPGARPSVGSLAPVRPSQRPSAPLTALGGRREPESEGLAERTVLAAPPAGFMADALQPRRVTPPPPFPVGAGPRVGIVDDGIEWFLALDGAQQGPFPRKGLIDKLLALPKNADVHVWNDRMDGWKPPKDVPDVAHDLAARRPPAVPVRPPVPRVTPSPPLPPTAARRSSTQPQQSGAGSTKLPAPSARLSGAHSIPGPAGAAHAGRLDPAAMQETPGPSPALSRPAKTNGVGTHPATPVSTFPAGESDALSALNLGGNGTSRAAMAAPRVMLAGEATAWSGPQKGVEGRHGSTKMIVTLLGVVGVAVVLITLNMTRKSTTVAAPPRPTGALDSESLAKMAETVAHEKQAPVPAPTPAIAPVAAAEAPKGKPSHGHAPSRGGHAAPVHVARGGPPPGTRLAPAAEDPNAARFRETPSARSVVPTAAVSNRPAPNQGEISRVIANNKIGIKTCYQRALLRDSSLTHGKITVRVTIGISGRVKNTVVDGPIHFRALEPCIKEMLARWVFPQSYEEYGTEFSYVFQGNE